MTVNGVGGGLASLNALFQSGGAQTVGAVAGGNDPDGDGDVHGAGRVSGDSAQISGPGKLLGQLQQLQSQDPTKFKQVTADIATQLQTAAKQSTGNEASFLANLANKFETASSTGNLSALQPSHHHGHHAHGTYNQQGQVAPPAPTLPGVSPTTDTSSASGPNIGQLFANIAKEVSQAVGAGAA